MNRPRRDHSHRRWQRDPLPPPSPPPSRRRRHLGLWLPWVLIMLLAGIVYILADGAVPFRKPGEVVAGHAMVTDGDTIKIGGRRIRLHGIDAPESDQRCTDSAGAYWRCGSRATRALAEKIDGRGVSCRGRGYDRYGRVIGVCEAGGDDLNGWMVRQGWAVAYKRYSYRYIPDELIARAAGRGIWAGDFTTPEDWRHHRR